MRLNYKLEERSFQFRFDAGTSRGVMKEKKSWFVFLSAEGVPNSLGLGEAGPLPGLSPEPLERFSELATEILDTIVKEEIPANQDFSKLLEKIPADMPSLRFAFETALIDLINGGKGVLFESDFTKGEMAIPINGLVWMGSPEFMMQQVDDLVKRGFRCIKMKVGALDFDAELSFLQSFRKKYPASEYELRLDANGAFSPEDALRKLGRLSTFGIHSIEQPIKPGQTVAMARICRNSEIPVALDEELIGINQTADRNALLEEIKPAYIILKPSLVGGLLLAGEWISLAESMNIGWWLTSALESNVGLNAICQFGARYNLKMPQGFGTGSLYHNNIPSPLYLDGPFMKYKA